MIKTESYPPAGFAGPADIPVVTMPVGINLWCFKGTPAVEQEVVVRAFEFVGK